MGPIAATKSVFSKYVDMTGRASRSEYWWWGLIHMLLLTAFVGVDVVRFDPTAPLGSGSLFANAAVIYILATLVPNITVMVRRLHDTGRSGAWYFITLIPLVGAIWFLVLMVLPSQDDDNRFGPPPNGKSWKRTDVSNEYVAAFTTDPRISAMKKMPITDEELRESAMSFQEQRKAEISDYYKNKVLGELPGSADPA